MEEFLSRINTHLKDYSEKCKVRENKSRTPLEIKNARIAFRNTFDQTYLAQLKDFVKQLKEAFRQNELDLKLESHQYSKFFNLSMNSDKRIYIVIAVASTKLTMWKRWDNATCLIFDGDFEDNKVRLYQQTNLRTASMHNYRTSNVLATYCLDQYDLTKILVHVEKFLAEQLNELSK